MLDFLKQTEDAEIVVSNTYLSGFYEIIDRIKQKTNQNKFENIILVVPDKFSLNAEQIFMERIGLSSVFNVWLTTLSRLVSKVCADDEKKFSVLTKNSGTMLVSHIIHKNIDKISTYKKISNNYSLAETMYNVINLLKSSGVTPEELKKNFGDTNFGLKIKDIYLIYNEYEKSMKEHIDTITRLQMFDEKIKNDDYIKNSHIFFAMFESFTNVQLNSLTNLAKNAKSFCVSMCANTLQPNHYIYDNSLFYRLKDYFDNVHISYKITNTTAKLNSRNNFLANNFLSYSTDKKFETDNIRIMECDNVSEEVRYVANRIKFLVTEKKYTFDDVNVAVNGLGDYSTEIEKIFAEYNLPFYIDSSRTMTDHFFVKALFQIANFVCGEKSISNAISIVKYPLFDIEYQKKCDFENYCKKYNIFGEALYSRFEQDDDLRENAELVRNFVFDKIEVFEKELCISKNTQSFKNTLINYLNSIPANTVLQNYAERQIDIIQKQIDVSVYEKFMNALDDCDSLLSLNEMPKEMFFDMLKSVLSSINLQTVPLRCDAVFVGDASQSTYYPRNILFVMGSSDSRMPSYQSDAGTITDDEIEKFVSTKRISPTIKELNKREKFKLFNLILLPSDLLELSFSVLVNGKIEQKCDFVASLQSIITQNGIPLKVQKYAFEEQKILDDSNPNLLAYMVGTTKNAVRLSISKESKVKYLLNRDFHEMLNDEKIKYLDSPSRFNLSDAKKYLFDNDKTSISQVEKYFRCPFLQFVEHGISPKENQKFELKANDVGTILHSVAQKFVNKFIEKNFSNENVEKLSKDIFNEIMSQKKYKSFTKNKYYLSMLEEEAVRFCKAIKYQIDSSDFKPVFTEKYFDNYTLKNGLKFSGVVDRVDVYNNLIRIIDYKTGSEKFSFKNLYYGLKLQLVAYMKVLAEKLNQDVIGTMYMPVKNKFGDFFDGEFKSYKLDGIFLNDEGIIKHLDKNLIENSKSDIIAVEYTKNGELSKRNLSHILSREELLKITEYSFNVLTKALDEMIDGYIEPKPYYDNISPCEFCKFKSLCHYQISKIGYRKFENKDKSSF